MKYHKARRKMGETPRQLPNKDCDAYTKEMTDKEKLMQEKFLKGKK